MNAETGSSDSASSQWFFTKEERPEGSLAVSVTLDSDGRVCLWPEDTVAALVLFELAHGFAIKPVQEHVFSKTESWAESPYKTLKRVLLEPEQTARLCHKGNPYATGMSVSEEEYAVARKSIERHRKRNKKNES